METSQIPASTESLPAAATPSLFQRLAQLPWIFILCVSAGFLTLTRLQMDGIANDPGLGWHLKTGEWIVNHELAVPRIDPFLFAYDFRSWVSDQWLADLLLYFMLGPGNWVLAYAFVTTLYLVTFFGVIYRGNSRYVGAGVAAIAALFSFKLGLIHFVIRPVLGSFVFFALVLNLLNEVYETKAVPRSHWWRLPCLFLVWANLHPSFVLGFGLLVILLLCIVIERFFLDEKLIPSQVTNQLTLIGLIAAACTLINPYGIELHRSILFLSHSDFFLNLNDEWKALDLRSPEGEWFMGMSGIVFASIFIFGRERLRIPLYSLLLTLVFAGLSLRSVRFLPYFGMVASLPFACVLATIPTRFSKILRYQDSSARQSEILFGFCTLLIGLSLALERVPAYDGDYGPSRSSYPYAALNFLKQHPEKGSVVLAHPNWGGFITWYGDGTLRPLIDDRNTLLGERIYQEFIEAFSPHGDWLSFARRHQAQALLLPKNHYLVKELSKHPSAVAERVYQDEVATLYLLSSPPT